MTRQSVKLTIAELEQLSRVPIAAPWLFNTHAGFDNLFRACAAEPACNAAHPRLEETFTGLSTNLKRIR
jgi:hypothetical protein